MSRCKSCDKIMTQKEMQQIDFKHEDGSVTYAEICSKCRRESYSEYSILSKDYQHDQPSLDVPPSYYAYRE